MRIVGIRTPLVEDMGENHKNIPNFWKETRQGMNFQKICSLCTLEPRGILGISVYQNPENIFYYIAAASDKPILEGMYEYEIPAATWVIFKTDGHFQESVQSVFQRFYKEWLLFSGYEYAGLPDIEVYPIEEEKPISGYSEVWIAIKKKEN